MSSWNQTPPEEISLDDAYGLVSSATKRRLPRFAGASSLLEILPRPSRLWKKLRRWWMEVAGVVFGICWLALPRDSTLGLLSLLAAVAVMHAAFYARRNRRRNRKA